MILIELHTRINNVINNLDNLVLDSAMENESTIADIQAGQLSKGLTNKNTPITPELRNDEYARIKKATGGKAPLHTPDLHDTGAFYRGIFANIKDKAIILDSTDDKTEDLKTKYADIFGLTPESLKELKEYTLPILKEKLKNELGIS